MKKVSLPSLVGYSLVVILAVISALTGIYVARHLEPPKDNHVQNQTDKDNEVDNFPVFHEFERLSGLHQTVEMAKDHPSYTPNSSLSQAYAKGLVATGKIKVNQTITKGYIYVAVSVDKGQRFTIADSISLKLGGIGGHLFRPLTEPVPKTDITYLMYDLREIPYLTTAPYSASKKPAIGSWFDLINKNVGHELSYEAFISSLRTNGEIEFISLAFDCENPDPQVACLALK